MPLLLTGDIGGTNSRFALYDASSCTLAQQPCLFRKSYKNADYDHFTNVLDAFIRDAKEELEKAGTRVTNNIVSGCLAVAGTFLFWVLCSQFIVVLSF